jgi:hypothetical protein
LGAVWRVLAVFAWIADLADTFASRLVPRGRKGLTRRLHVGVAFLVFVLAAIAGSAITRGIPLFFAVPVDIHQLPSSESDVHATITGVLADQYIETYPDYNRDRQQQANESGTAWLYFVGTGDGSHGITVESDTPPDEMFALRTDVTLTGRLDAGSHSLPEVPGFSSSTLPFHLSDRWFYDRAEFVEITNAREATTLIGPLVVLLILGTRFGYPIFRRSPDDGQEAMDRSTRLVVARLFGPVAAEHGTERRREVPASALVYEDTFGRRYLVFTPPGVRGEVTPLASFPAAMDDRYPGEAISIGGSRWALAHDGADGRVVAAFNSLADRDYLLGEARPA